MKLNIFAGKLKQSLSQNQILAVGLVAVVILATLQQLKINQMRERVVILPAGMTEKTEIATRSANEAYYKSWGVFVSSQVGSVTPGEAESTATVLEPYFTREAWLPVKSHLNSIRLDPNYQQYAAVNQFSPKLAIYEPSTNKTFVQGTQKTSVYRDNKALPLSQMEVTYEMDIKIQSGVPKVTNITSYRGPAHTIAWAQRFPSAAAAFKAQQANRPDQLTPQLSGSDDGAADAPAGSASAPAGNAATPALVAPPSPTDAAVDGAPSDGASRPPAAAARNGNQPDSTLSSADRL